MALKWSRPAPAPDGPGCHRDVMRSNGAVVLIIAMIKSQTLLCGPFRAAQTASHTHLLSQIMSLAWLLVPLG